MPSCYKGKAQKLESYAAPFCIELPELRDPCWMAVYRSWEYAKARLRLRPQDQFFDVAGAKIVPYHNKYVTGNGAR